MPAWRGEGAFLDNLKADTDVTAKLKPAELDTLFDDSHHLKHVDTIFRRVFGAA
jgi:adenylosuccinate lyase